MTTIDDVLATAQRARLIPTAATTRKEERLVSVLLAALSVVRPLAESILRQCGARMGKRGSLETFTEVTFPTDDGNENRPDGVLRLATGKSTWTALVEAKVDKSVLDADQMERYARIARDFGVDAIPDALEPACRPPDAHSLQHPRAAGETVLTAFTSPGSAS